VGSSHVQLSLAVVNKIDKYEFGFPFKKVLTRNTIYHRNNQVSFFDGLYKFKFRQFKASENP